VQAWLDEFITSWAFLSAWSTHATCAHRHGLQGFFHLC
jgi:hypothetical protein